MKYKPGTMDCYEDSMAERSRIVFEKLWKDKYGADLPSETEEDRRMLFVAIAQGVIQHLKVNARDAFDIEVNVEPQTNIGIPHTHPARATVNILTVEGGLYP